MDIDRASRLAVELDVCASKLLLKRMCLVVDPFRFVGTGYGSEFSADCHAVAAVQFSNVVFSHDYSQKEAPSFMSG